MRIAIVFAVVVWAGGCANRYGISDVRITDTPGAQGYRWVAACDTCPAHSPCGRKAETFAWAGEHYQKTGHPDFTRGACADELREPWTSPVGGDSRSHAVATPPVQRAGQDGRGSVSAPSSAGEDVVKVGMTLDEVREAIGDYGRPDAEYVDRRVIRFVQTKRVGDATAMRNVWGEFKDGKLTTATYGPWNR